MASAAAASANVTPPGSLDEDQVGFPKEILGTELEGKYLCSECGNILRRPFQAQCGHRYCASCLQRLISSGPQKCGACIQEGIYEDGVSILETGSAFPDNAARREVESLPAICANEGCAWKGTIKEYESGHGGSCPWALATCPSCRGPVRRRDQERHAARECPQRSLSCKFCKALCHFPQIKAHDEVCPKFPLTCEGCGKRKIPREKFPEHVKSCSKCKAPCRFQPIGCNVVVSPSRWDEAGPIIYKYCIIHYSNCPAIYNKRVRVTLPSFLPSLWQVRQLERSLASKDLALISDFTKKRQEAVAGRSPAIFSPAFYTGKYGYKMCLRIYLNGDGTGRGTHLSLFFVVMRGPCDALLRWPFNQKVGDGLDGLWGPFPNLQYCVISMAGCPSVRRAWMAEFGWIRCYDLTN
uniref:TNF receptor-associated factor n=1 Tax=Anolis carolinensis TaxID=28377 RepID=H9GCC0_ANOCA